MKTTYNLSYFTIQCNHLNPTPLVQVVSVELERAGGDGGDPVTGINLTFSAGLRPVPEEEDRFMVCCLERPELCDQRSYEQPPAAWEGVLVTASSGATVRLDTSEACGGSGQFSSLAYLWREGTWDGSVRNGS